MANILDMHDLLSNTIEAVTSNEEEWRDFLHTAAKLNKYSLMDQLQIYAQKPGIDAAGEYGVWGKVGCHVMRGSHGIPLLADNGNKVRYVFDIADVAPDPGREKPPLFQMTEEKLPFTIKELEKAYGETTDTLTDTERLIELAERAADEYVDANISTNSRELFRGVFKSSVVFMVLDRCGFDPAEYENHIDFSDLGDFREDKVLDVLNTAFHSTSTPLISEIARAVFKYDRQQKIIEEEKNHDKAVSREEGRDDLSDSRDQRVRSQDNHEVREPSAAISEGSPDRAISDADEDRGAAEPSNRRAGSGRGNDRPADERTGEERRSEQSAVPGEMGGDGEHPEESGRDNTVGSGVPGDTGSELRRDDRPVRIGDYEPSTIEDLRAVRERLNYLNDSLSVYRGVMDNTSADRSERREASMRFDSTKEEIDTVSDLLPEELAVSARDQIVFVQVASDGGYDYTIYDKDYHEIEGGVLDDDTLRIDEVLNDILSDSFNITIDEPGITMLSADEVRERATEVGLADLEEERAEKSPATYTIYQIDDDAENRRDIIFEGLDRLAARGLSVDPANYKEVYAGTLEDGDTLDSLYEKFNINHPADYKGHSMSVSDVVVIHGDSGDRAYFVDSIGFTEVPEFLKEREVPLAVKDITNIRYLGAETTNSGHTIEYTLEADIRGERQTLHYEVTRHDGDEESFSIHTDKDDIYDRFSESDLRLLEDRLSDEVHVGRYLADIEKAADLDELKMVQYGFMEDENFPERLTGRFWTAYNNKEEILSPGEEIAGENRAAELPVDQPSLEQPKPEQTAETEKAGNYHILDDDLGVGGQKQKYHNNTAAITVLKQIEDEDRTATLQEQKILSQYVGWGGLADAFDPSKANWSMEYNELKSLLTDEEYEAARSSTLNAHYTQPAIIRAMYDKLADLGFSKGNILEPAMGVGNFFGAMPEEMRQSNLYGVELDSITGRIARQLYPDANVTIGGFETTNFPNDSFDVAIGNVPFGDYKVNDPEYNDKNFLIHDYFFAKALDKVKPGGIVAFVTSSGTMDKQNTEVREYLARHADLLGAVRLPNDAFLANAGTSVTADILFLQKRSDVLIGNDLPSWVELGETDDGIPVNSYFADRPDMILGKLEMVSGRFGDTVTCTPDKSRSLSDQLASAMSRITGEIDPIETDVLDLGNLSADEQAVDVPSYSFYIHDGDVYYKDKDSIEQVQQTGKRLERIKDLIPLRDSARELLKMQLDPNVSEIAIAGKRAELNRLYDDFIEKHDYINSRGNSIAFGDDASYPLICSLERFDDDGQYLGKADIFDRRTVSQAVTPTHADTSVDALAICLNDLGRVDIPHMAELTGFDESRVVADLQGQIYKDPETTKYVTADEYLSGNIRHKLELAEGLKNDPDYAYNAEALRNVMPEWIPASDIEITLGNPWIGEDLVNQFMQEIFKTPAHLFDTIKVEYSPVSGAWNVSNTGRDSGNPIISTTYGTGRKNAYELLEASLNLKTVKIYDHKPDGTSVANPKETILANQKQDAIKEAFHNWIYADPDRRRALEEKYNTLFNSIRPRQYDGSHLTFPGMSPAISLRDHQKDAIAHVLYGDSTLLAHSVGAGKTFEMVAAAMESKRLGLCKKSMIVVPDHLTEQEGGDFLRLYPGAKVLVATKKDFEPARRKKFCARVATGDYDAIIIGHSQFERIPLSKERQVGDMKDQIKEITASVDAARVSSGKNSFSVKEMEKMKKKLSTKLEKLNDIKQDNVVTFEELGVDKLFVDESHYYKNLYLNTKMNNVAGVQTTDAQKASDMYAKCRYINEITDNKGVVFATGTPVANSMTELYTNMRYLMPHKLKAAGLEHFDAWAAAFGQTVTALELAPEGTGYRLKTRFSKFYNLPELMSMFKECADVKTSDLLNLDVPEAEYVDVTLPPSDDQKQALLDLAERAKKIRSGGVNSKEDNMLAVTNDGRVLALDQRLYPKDNFSEEPNGKTMACAENVYKVWESTKENKSTQIIFCDQSTPKDDGSYDVYHDIKQKLMDRGVPENEIAFIHDAKTDAQKDALFAKVRAGQVRVLIGSTGKMGTGTNVQKRLIALHHLDAPWRPADIEQREGRIIRQGNDNPKVQVYRYLKEGTFDAYMWQTLKQKQSFIGQIMTSRTPSRSMDDIDGLALSYAEVMSLCTGDPRIKERMDLEIDVEKLKLAKSAYSSNLFRLQDEVALKLPGRIRNAEHRIEAGSADTKVFAAAVEEAKKDALRRATARAQAEREEKNRKRAERGQKPDDSELNIVQKASDAFRAVVGGKTYFDRSEAETAVMAELHKIPIDEFDKQREIGEYMGFKIAVHRTPYNVSIGNLVVMGADSRTFPLGLSGTGIFRDVLKDLNGLQERIALAKNDLAAAKQALESAKVEVAKPFEKEAELAEKQKRLDELTAALGLDKAENEGVDMVEDDVPEEKPVQVQTKINKTKDGGFSVSVKDWTKTLGFYGIEKSTKFGTEEEAKTGQQEIVEKIEKALEEEAQPVTVDRYRAAIERVSDYMDSKGRRTMTDDQETYCQDKLKGLIETLKNDPLTVKVGEKLEAEKDAGSCHNTWQFKEVTREIVNPALRKAVCADFSAYKNRPELVTAAMSDAMQIFAKNKNLTARSIRVEDFNLNYDQENRTITAAYERCEKGYYYNKDFENMVKAGFIPEKFSAVVDNDNFEAAMKSVLCQINDASMKVELIRGREYGYRATLSSMDEFNGEKDPKVFNEFISTQYVDLRHAFEELKASGVSLDDPDMEYQKAEWLNLSQRFETFHNFIKPMNGVNYSAENGYYKDHPYQKLDRYYPDKVTSAEIMEAMEKNLDILAGVFEFKGVDPVQTAAIRAAYLTPEIRRMEFDRNAEPTRTVINGELEKHKDMLLSCGENDIITAVFDMNENQYEFDHIFDKLENEDGEMCVTVRTHPRTTTGGTCYGDFNPRQLVLNGEVIYESVEVIRDRSREEVQDIFVQSEPEGVPVQEEAPESPAMPFEDAYDNLRRAAASIPPGKEERVKAALDKLRASLAENDPHGLLDVMGSGEDLITTAQNVISAYSSAKEEAYQLEPKEPERDEQRVEPERKNVGMDI